MYSKENPMGIVVVLSDDFWDCLTEREKNGMTKEEHEKRLAIGLSKKIIERSVQEGSLGDSDKE
ncbi:MAG: hypothetical protein ACLQQ4_11760 [Bacteroidia bacterium]